MSSDVGKGNGKIAVGNCCPVEVVAAGVIGGLVPASDVETLYLWLFPGEQ